VSIHGNHMVKVDAGRSDLHLVAGTEHMDGMYYHVVKVSDSVKGFLSNNVVVFSGDKLRHFLNSGGVVDNVEVSVTGRIHITDCVSNKIPMFDQRIGMSRNTGISVLAKEFIFSHLGVESMNYVVYISDDRLGVGMTSVDVGTLTNFYIKDVGLNLVNARLIKSKGGFNITPFKGDFKSVYKRRV